VAKHNAGHLDLPLILRCEASEAIEKLETENQEKSQLEVSRWFVPCSKSRSARKAMMIVSLFSKRFLSQSAFLGLALLGSSHILQAPAQAQEEGWIALTDKEHQKGKDWSGTFGVVGYYESEYEGSDEYSLNAFPWIEVTYRNRFYFSSHEGVGAHMLATDSWTLGAGLDYYMGRGDDESDYLRRLGDISPGLEAKLFAKYHLENLTLSATLRQDVMGNDDGTLLTGAISYDFNISDGIRMSLGLDGTVMSEQYAQTYYGVSRRQAAASGYRQYTPEAGIKDIGASIKGEYNFNETWGLMGLARYSMLGDAATGSPFNRSDYAIHTALGVGYRF